MSATYDDDQLVWRLISMKVRTPVITAATGVNEKRVRSLFHEMHGEKPESGRSAEDAEWYLKPSNHLDSSIASQQIHAVRLDHASATSLQTREGGTAFCDAYDHYKEAIPAKGDPRLDANRFYKLISFMREHTLGLKVCKDCQTPYAAPQHFNIRNCPFCQAIRAAGVKTCKKCDGPLDTHHRCRNVECRRQSAEQRRVQVNSFSLPSGDLGFD